MPAAPPLLILHGYGAESRQASPAAVRKSYEPFLRSLRRRDPAPEIRELDLTRWISLDDGVGLDDVTLAMDRALHSGEFAATFRGTFYILTHSTGALVARNWILRHGGKPSRVRKLIHFAPALFGSGLAHLGRTQLARWGRSIFGGTTPGVRFLQALELGTHETINLHLALLAEGNRMLSDFGVREFAIVGSQVPTTFRQAPVRYLKEDGSDCTVRCPAANPNFIHLKISPKVTSEKISFEEAVEYAKSQLRSYPKEAGHYTITSTSLPGDDERSKVPFGIPFDTAHVDVRRGNKTGILGGEDAWENVFPFAEAIFDCSDTSLREYENTVRILEDLTRATYAKAALLKPDFLEWDRRAQYDPHAMAIFRVFDQEGRPVPSVDINFDSKLSTRPRQTLGNLIEHTHVHRLTPGTLTFYFRLGRFDESTGTWLNRLDGVSSVHLEITALEPASRDTIAYLPLRVELSQERLRRLLRFHTTTVIDVTLLRVPSSHVFRIFRVEK